MFREMIKLFANDRQTLQFKDFSTQLCCKIERHGWRSRQKEDGNGNFIDAE